MFWYFPIEPYEERYSVYLSAEDGFWETFLKENNIEHVSLRPEIAGNRLRVGKGFVLDTYRRCVWSMRQIEMFLQELDAGNVKDGDVLYLEDFWHPGFEALPYARSMYKVDFKIYAWCHAQSVDSSDFTALMGMTPWMRYFEQGIAQSLAGIFVADAGLKEKLLKPDDTTADVLLRNALGQRPGGQTLAVNQAPIFPVGTCWNTQWIRNRYSYDPQAGRVNRVVFASRWDKEKNPEFYCKLAKTVAAQRQDIKFVVTTGFAELTSNEPKLVDLAYETAYELGNQFQIMENVSKAEYMKLLNTSRVHFNCASHDWVSYALLESCSMGCMPLFPIHKAFPPALMFDLRYLYGNSGGHAIEKLYALIDSPQRSMDHILTRFDNSIPFVAYLMGLTPKQKSA